MANNKHVQRRKVIVKCLAFALMSEKSLLHYHTVVLEKVKKFIDTYLKIVYSKNNQNSFCFCNP